MKSIVNGPKLDAIVKAWPYGRPLEPREGVARPETLMGGEPKANDSIASSFVKPSYPLLSKSPFRVGR